MQPISSYQITECGINHFFSTYVRLVLIIKATFHLGFCKPPPNAFVPSIVDGIFGIDDFHLGFFNIWNNVWFSLDRKLIEQLVSIFPFLWSCYAISSVVHVFKRWKMIFLLNEVMYLQLIFVKGRKFWGNEVM